jgi:hypothetical protein
MPRSLLLCQWSCDGCLPYVALLWLMDYEAEQEALTSACSANSENIPSRFNSTKSAGINHFLCIPHTNK